VRKELRAKVPESRMVGLEKESTDWYKSQTKKRSMFGRTLNPLTGYAPSAGACASRAALVNHVASGVPPLCPRCSDVAAPA